MFEIAATMMSLRCSRMFSKRVFRFAGNWSTRKYQSQSGIWTWSFPRRTEEVAEALAHSVFSHAFAAQNSVLPQSHVRISAVQIPKKNSSMISHALAFAPCFSFPLTVLVVSSRSSDWMLLIFVTERSSSRCSSSAFHPMPSKNAASCLWNFNFQVSSVTREARR